MKEFQNEFTWGKALQSQTEDEFHANFDKAVEQIKNELGKTHPIIINGKKLFVDDCFEVQSPADRHITVAKFPNSSEEQLDEAIKSAKDALFEWSTISFEKRARIFRECADIFSMQKFYLAAIMTFENGKNRIEAMGDVDEAIDFMRFYAWQLEKNNGFQKLTYHPNPKEKTQSVLKPFGVWGIISPFNFPSAIAIGMTTGALITGNTTILKPASDAPLSSFNFVKVLYTKLPDGAVNFVTGPGHTIGKKLIQSTNVDGIAFTGSSKIGMSGFREFTKTKAKPFIAEMGGKNPVIVTENANLEKAANGIVNAAFGYGGQKCSACSRVYVQKDVAGKLMRLLVEKTQKLKIGFPWQKEVFLGPIINASAKARYEEVISLAKKDGQILTGGSIITLNGLDRGFFVEPTIIIDLPEKHKLMREELFLPVLCLQQYEDFEKAIELANDSEYGLTAGIFSNDKKQIDEFFMKIQAGVVYANRQASATTAALVHSQPFVGWKNSGSTGKGAGGEYYLQQFLREQTQTRCD